MTDNTSEKHAKKLEKLQKALKARFGEIEDFEEEKIRKGVGVTSLIKLKPRGHVYSKCFKPELYGGVLQEYVIRNEDDLDSSGYSSKNNDIQTVSEKYDLRKGSLSEYESDILEKLNRVSSEEIKRDFSLKIAPELYARIPEDDTFLMEYIASPSYKQKFIEIDQKLDGLESTLKEIKDRLYQDKEAVEKQIKDEIKTLKRQRADYRGKGLFYIARLHHLCNSNPKLFEDIRKRRRGEEVVRQREYLKDLLLDCYKEEGLKREEIYKYLKNEKKQDLNEIIKESLDMKKDYSGKLIKVHGDFGAQHLTIDGICFDFDEFRLDLPQDDIVRFLNSEFVSPRNEKLRDAEEKKIKSYIADYFVDRKRYEGVIPWDKKYSAKAEKLIADHGLDAEFNDFLLTYYCERIEEDIHIYAINKGAGEAKLKNFAEGHPGLTSLEDFQKFRINDINRVISLLLGTKYGRETILGENKKITKFFESMRSFFEISGIKTEERFEKDGSETEKEDDAEI
jgi:hypothetical protein